MRSIFAVPGRSHLKGADRKEAQIDLGIFALLPEALEGMVEGPPQTIVILADHEADPLSEEAALQIGTARKGAAARSLRTPEPEREVQAVGEKVVHLPVLQRRVRRREIRQAPQGRTR